MCKDAAQPRFPKQDAQHAERTQTFTLATLIYYGANRAPVARLPSEDMMFIVSKNSLTERLGILGESGKTISTAKVFSKHLQSFFKNGRFPLFQRRTDLLKVNMK